MRAPWFLRVLAVATALLVWSPGSVDAQCPGGRFVARDALDPDAEPVLVVIDTDRKPNAFTGCGTVKPQRGTKKWPLRAKLSDCGSPPKRRKLLGRWSLDCSEVSLQVRGKRLRRAFLAEASACGDGLVDALRGEQCESAADCGVGGQCYEQCRCEPPPTTTTLLETSTTSTTVTDGSTTTTTFPVVPLTPGDVVTVTTESREEVHRFGIQLDDPAPVLIRAVDVELHGAPCFRAFDEEGEPVAPTECSDLAMPLPVAHPAGELTIQVTWSRTGTYVLQYLPLAPGLIPAVPVGFDPFFDDELPAAGLLEAYSLTLDAPRRVFVRLADRNEPPVFQPCVQVFAAGQEFGDAPFRCAEAPILDLALEAGAHSIVVSDRFHDSDGAYRLQVMQLAPAFARELTGEPDCRALGDTNDLDVYAFTVTSAATPVSLNLAEFGANPDAFNPCLRLWNGENGPLLFGEVECSGPGEFDQVLEPGTYYVTIHDDLRNAAGGYCLSVQ